MLTALVVDDNQADAESAGRVLAAAGYTVHCASDAAEALALQARFRPDVVVCDVSMPVHDGPTILRALSAQGCTATYVAMTSDATPEVRQRCRAAGAVECLQKPVTGAILVALAGQVHSHGSSGYPGDDLCDPDDAELLDSLRATFLELLPARVAALRDAADLTELTGAAHVLAGASAQFRYPDLAALCRAVERASRSGERDPDLIEAILAATRDIQSTSR